MRLAWKCSAHVFARIVIAGNADKRQIQRRQQPLEVFIFLGRRRIGEIAGNHDKIGPRLEFVQRGHAALKRLRGIDASVGERTRRLDMQVGNLRYENGLKRHLCSIFSSPAAEAGWHPGISKARSVHRSGP